MKKKISFQRHEGKEEVAIFNRKEQIGSYSQALLLLQMRQVRTYQSEDAQHTKDRTQCRHITWIEKPDSWINSNIDNGKIEKKWGVRMRRENPTKRCENIRKMSFVNLVVLPMLSQLLQVLAAICVAIRAAASVGGHMPTLETCGTPAAGAAEKESIQDVAVGKSSGMMCIIQVLAAICVAIRAAASVGGHRLRQELQKKNQSTMSL